MNLIQINPLVSPQWDKAVLNSPSPQFFHLSCWTKTLIDTYNFKPLCFMLQTDKEECTIPMVIVRSLKGKKKGIALPFSDGCDIHCEGIPHSELAKRLLGVAREQKLHRLEFRGTVRFRPSEEPSHSYFGHHLQLTIGEKLLWKNLSSSKKRNIKKSQSQNTTVAFHNGHSAVREFYRLHCITRKRHGLPPQPVSFFDNIYRNIIQKNTGEVALAYSGNTIVAGAVYLFSKSEVLYKFGASNKDLQHMRANDLLMWEAINRYAQKGFKTLSFGKTEKFHEGLWRFKEGFGASRVIMNDYCYDVKSGKKVKDSPSVHGIHNAVFRRMPIGLLRLSGEILYKYSA